jgi:diguanylate cyclase (GGDEF)-like protein
MSVSRAWRFLARHRALAVVYLSLPLGALGFWWFRDRGLIAPVALWVLALMLVTTGLLNFASYAWLRADPRSGARLQCRLAVSALTTTAVIYATGWGPTLSVAYGVGVATVLQEAGSRSWRPGIAWVAVGLTAGELAVALGWAPTLIEPDLTRAMAVAALGCLAIVIRVLGLTAEAEEAAEARLRDDALHDHLTGLWNRGAFTQFADKARARAARDGSTIALLFIDLDGFKHVNDTVGHDLGDHVLVEVAHRMQECLRAEDALARLGGDEFTALLEGVSTPALAIEVAERILATVGRTSTFLSEPHVLGASIGIALSPGGGRTTADLLRDSDNAMYAAKRAGGSQWRLVPTEGVGART